MYNSDCSKDTFKKERKSKEFECCVCVNIFCDDSKKESKFKEYEYKDECKKENECKENECCVCINIFCDKCKEDHIWQS